MTALTMVRELDGTEIDAVAGGPGWLLLVVAAAIISEVAVGFVNGAAEEFADGDHNSRKVN